RATAAMRRGWIGNMRAWRVPRGLLSPTRNGETRGQASSARTCRRGAFAGFAVDPKRNGPQCGPFPATHATSGDLLHLDAALQPGFLAQCLRAVGLFPRERGVGVAA